ncbi:MAG TPA: hypothetical protein VF950_17500 [Planctomycetota bacterium]
MQELSGGFVRPLLDKIADRMRTVHKLLIDEGKRAYERERGQIKGPYALFALVAQDPFFAWLQPMTRLLVEIDDLGDRKDKPLGREDLEWVRKRFDGLLAARTEAFSIRYHDLLHTSPDVVAEHGRLQAALRAIGPRPTT